MYLRLPEQERSSIADLERFVVRTPGGSEVPLEARRLRRVRAILHRDSQGRRSARDHGHGERGPGCRYRATGHARSGAGHPGPARGRAPGLRLRSRWRAEAAAGDHRRTVGLDAGRLHHHLRPDRHPLRLLVPAAHHHGRHSPGPGRRGRGPPASGPQFRLHVGAGPGRLYRSRRERLAGHDHLHQREEGRRPRERKRRSSPAPRPASDRSS